MQAEKILSVLSYGGKGKRMKRSSALMQTISIEKEHTSIRDSWGRLCSRWMRLFLIEDTLPGKRSIVELQRRAIWIGVAMLLFTALEFGYGLLRFLYELGSSWYIILLQVIGSLVILALVLAG